MNIPYENSSKTKNIKLLKEDMKIKNMFPVVSNGNIFSVISMQCQTKPKIELETWLKSNSQLVILKYNKDTNEMIQIYDQLLTNSENFIPIKNGDNIYFSTFKNEKEDVQIELWKYNF